MDNGTSFTEDSAELGVTESMKNLNEILADDETDVCTSARCLIVEYTLGGFRRRKKFF